MNADGSVWCGGERGQIYRIEPDGSVMEQVASTGGFCLGLAFGPSGDLFVCDAKHASVMRVDVRAGRVETFAKGASGRRMRLPNYPAFDCSGNLFVSDSNAMGEPGPGVYRFAHTGDGELWFDGHTNFTNGIAFDKDGRQLYVVETFGSAIFRLPLLEDVSRPPYEDVSCLVRDEEAHVLCHPTNVALRGRTLFASNLGRWHITALELPDRV